MDKITRRLILSSLAYLVAGGVALADGGGGHGGGGSGSGGGGSGGDDSGGDDGDGGSGGDDGGDGGGGGGGSGSGGGGSGGSGDDDGGGSGSGGSGSGGSGSGDKGDGGDDKGSGSKAESDRGRRDQDDALKAVSSGKAVPLNGVISFCKRTYSGKVLNVNLRNRAGKLVYEVRMIDKNSVVKKIVLDAKTLAKL